MARRDETLSSPMRRRLLAATTVAPLTGIWRASRAAAPYPTRPVRLVVGFAPGGGNDILARFFAQQLQESFKQTVVVENRPGASGVLAVEAVRQAAPDGHTLLVAPSSSMTVNPVLMKSLSYDPRRDLAPIGLLGRFPLVLVVNPELPARTVPELVALARSQAGALAYASASTSYQLATEMLAQMAGISLTHVPYKGSAPALQAVAGGEVPLALADAAAALPLVRAGRLRALGVSTATPTRTMPQVAPIAEQGVGGYDTAVWAGLFAPRATEPAVIDALQSEIARIGRQPEAQERLIALGIEPASSTPDELRARIRREIEQHARTAERANIKPD